MKRSILIAAALLSLIAAPLVQSAAARDDKAEPVMLAAAGKKNVLDAGHYFTWEFDRTPKMGTAILKVRIFDKAGEQVTAFEVTGRSDMPSMRGAHDSGDVAFKLNKKGDYLLPVNIVMPGDWEVVLTFSAGGRTVLRGRILFDV